MKLIDVVRCEDCIHNDEGRCELNEYEFVKSYQFCWWGQTAEGRKSIEVDAVPVVHCKDCKYAEIIDERYGVSCGLWDGWFAFNEYCSSGIRRRDHDKQDGND